jgi:hypothetical protein
VALGALGDREREQGRAVQPLRLAGEEILELRRVDLRALGDLEALDFRHVRGDLVPDPVELGGLFRPEQRQQRGQQQFLPGDEGIGDARVGDDRGEGVLEGGRARARPPAPR